MLKPPFTIAEFMSRHALLSAQAGNYDPSLPNPPPVTEDEVRARIAFLRAGNARLKREMAGSAQPQKALPTTLAAFCEKQAMEKAEALMRQMGLKHV